MTYSVEKTGGAAVQKQQKCQHDLKKASEEYQYKNAVLVESLISRTMTPITTMLIKHSGVENLIFDELEK